MEKDKTKAFGSHGPWAFVAGSAPGTMSGNVKVNFSVDQSRILSSNGNMDMQMKMNIGSQGANARSGSMVLEMFQLPSGK